ncbi:MAG: HD-GYP domain-containing protein [Nitrospirota bacterium]
MGTKVKEIEEPDVPVQAEHLVIGTRLPCTLFITDKGERKPIFSRDMLFTAISKSLLKEKGIAELYIYLKDVPDFESYVARHLPGKGARYTDTIRVYREYAFSKEQYHQVDRALIIPGSKIPFTLYLLNRFSFIPLYEIAGGVAAEVDQSVLSADGDLVIRNSDIPLYHDYIKSLWQAAAPLREHHLKMKSLAVKETSKIILKDLLDDPRSGEKIKQIDPLVNEMIDCILENRDAIYDLLSLGGYDYYTYTHSVNVAALSIGLAIGADVRRQEVEKLGIGAMLHDVGKSAISHEILHKQGKLDDAEYRTIQNHVIEGERILKTHKEFPREAFSAVLQHHEKLSGKGYPLKLSGEQIDLFGRITAIADCYDALTTRRPYKPALTPFYSLSIIAKETGDYDPDLLKVFIKMLGKIK